MRPDGEEAAGEVMGRGEGPTLLLGTPIADTVMPDAGEERGAAEVEEAT